MHQSIEPSWDGKSFKLLLQPDMNGRTIEELLARIGLVDEERGCDLSGTSKTTLLTRQVEFGPLAGQEKINI